MTNTTHTTTTYWHRLRAGSYATEDGWNAWRRSDGDWNLRTPAGQYHRVPTLQEAKSLALDLRAGAR